MRVGKTGRINTTKWNKESLKKITKELSKAGLYLSESKPMIPRQLKCVIQAFYSFKRAFDPRTNFEPASKAENLISSHHPGLLHDGAGSSILRRAPASLRESIARDLVESSKLDSFSTKFRLTALLISRGIRDQETIEATFPVQTLTYSDFIMYQPRVDKLISSAKSMFFRVNKYIDAASGLAIWKKFDVVWRGLSQKQKSALGLYIMADEPLPLDAAAKRLKISKSAFRERIETAFKKIQNAFPELKQLKVESKAKITTGILLKTKKIKLRKNAPKPEVLKKWINETTPEMNNILDWEAVYWKGRARLKRGFKLDKF